MSGVSLSARARRDLLDIWLHIAADSVPAAERVYDRLEARLAILNTFPEAGEARPDIAPEARALTETPYIMLYRLRPQGLQIVRVMHGARDLDSTVFDEGVE